MAGIGGEAWSCGKPVFYNVCISLSNMSGPVIQGETAPSPVAPESHAHPGAFPTQSPPVMKQPMSLPARATAFQEEMPLNERVCCLCSNVLGQEAPKVDRRGNACRCGSLSPSAAAPGPHRLVGGELKPVHKTVITFSGVDDCDGEGAGTSSRQDGKAKRKTSGSKPTRRYSTIVSLDAGGRTMCTTRAQDGCPGQGQGGDEEDADSSLLRKISHTSDYSFSSESSLSSTSPTPSPRTSLDHGQDSDYFGSSSEDEGTGSEDEEEAEEEEGEEEEEEDIKETLRAAMERFQEGSGNLRGALGMRQGRWRRRADMKEYDLEQRIALEIKMREGTTKLLAACGAQGPRSNQPHTLEAAKNLLTSNERMTAYMAELQRRKTTTSCQEGAQPSLARVCLSDLRMPLIWKDSDHFKNKGDYRRFAVFVLLKIGTEIYDTVMVNPVDRSMTDICFDDIIVFNGIPPSFDCNMEVYSHVLQNDLTMASTPRKLKRSLHSSISRTVGRKLAASLRDELSNGELGPKFEMVATARLRLENVSNNTATHDLTLENTENRANQLPLFGHFCCRLAAQPDCATQERIAGYAHVPESEFQRSWCRLYGWQLEVWGNKEDVHLSPHHPLSLSIDRNTEISLNGVRIALSNTTGVDRGNLTLVLESPTEAASWHKCLQQHIADHRQWGAAAEEEMEILTPQPTRHNFIIPRRGRFASLYEETPLRGDGSPSSEKSSLDDLYGSSAFVNTYCTPAHATARPRAMTLSSRSSFRRWGSVKYNMPFFKSKS
ncbi:rhotekin-like [Macrobrachium nipponense]|uniref:rhotekin-like n=1 Tax=Macrobrachium nipponense TaxID=159736 RepID=UPI0030C84666